MTSVPSGRTTACHAEPLIAVRSVSGLQVRPPSVDDEIPSISSSPLTAVHTT
jgi:hypothetical protein